MIHVGTHTAICGSNVEGNFSALLMTKAYFINKFNNNEVCCSKCAKKLGLLKSESKPNQSLKALTYNNRKAGLEKALAKAIESGIEVRISVAKYRLENLK